MLNLLDSCCLDISVDLDSHRLVYGEKIKHSGPQRVKLANILPALLNKSLSYPEEVYDIYPKVFFEEDFDIAQSNISHDIIFLPAGLLGVEFVKTHIYYSPEAVVGNTSCIVEVQYGILTVLLQKNKPQTDIYDIDLSVEEGILMKLHKGEKASIPQGYFYTFINTEEIPVIFVRVYRSESVIDYNLVKKQHGLAYYCIRKNARQEIVFNPTYKNTPKIKEVGGDDFGDENFSMPLYQALRQELNSIYETLRA